MKNNNQDIKLACWTNQLKPSAIQQSISERDDLDDLISFALGKPNCALLPDKLINQATKEVLNDEPDAFLQYQKPPSNLKKHIVSIMKKRGVTCSEEEIILTNGGQQGIYLLTTLLLDQNDSVIAEHFTYPGFLQAIIPYNCHLLSVTTDFKNGINLDQLEKALAKKPTLLYIVPDGGSPHGASIHKKNRQKIADLAQAYQVPIIEDDPYGFLNYEGHAPPPIKAFNYEWVFYISTFSKIIAPSFRIGWIIIPRRLHSMLSILKDSIDINTGNYSQAILTKCLDRIQFDSYINNIKSHYQAKRDYMYHELKKLTTLDVKIVNPSCGVFFWLELNCNINTQKLVEVCINNYKVAFIPGDAFTCNTASCTKYIRLNFAWLDYDQIKEGVNRLYKALKYLHHL